MSEAASRDRLIDVAIDAAAPPAPNANIEHERRIALFDLKERNAFAVIGADAGPYVLTLASHDGRLHFSVASEAGAAICDHAMSLSPLRRLMKDYFLVCESYYAAIRDATPMQIEAIDMGRRGLHNEGADLLTKALEAKFTIDFETARRLFTLICALHVRS